ncbi:MAG: hypothetical protein RLZZ241_755 [Bacteroidota bacterium]
MHRQQVKEIVTRAALLDLLSALKNQLLKDFLRAGLSDFEGNLLRVGNNERLPELLREFLYKLLMEDFDGFLNLMYAADIPEFEFRTAVFEDPVEAADAALEILINREWQKVCLRAGISSRLPPDQSESR